MTHEPPAAMARINRFKAASAAFAAKLKRIGSEFEREGVRVRSVSG